MANILYGAYYAATIGNIILLIILSYLFIKDYREVKSKFSLGLVIFAGLLLLNALISCPVTSLFFFGHTCFAIGGLDLQAYAAVAEFIALLVLTYITIR